MLGIETLSQIYSEHVWLELFDTDLEQAKSVTQNYSNETGCKYAYLNNLCLNAFLRWIQENFGLATSASIFPSKKVLPKIWEFVNGCGINLGDKRLVLIPSDAIDIEDFAVPQEWVDIPNWEADYYLPIQIDLEKQYLHCWGVISRHSLKARADYDPIYRLYYVERDWIIPNLETLSIALNLCPDKKGKVADLPRLSATEAERLIEELSKPSLYSPRLKITFEKWGALLNDNHWLQKLYEQRLSSVSPAIHTLTRWLDGVVEVGWQTFEDVFTSKTLGPAFRAKRVRGIELETPESVRRAVRQLYNSQSDVAFPPDMKEPDALVHLLQNTPNESIRWKAAEYLWTIAPNYPGLAIRRVMDLGVQLMGYPIALMVAVLRKLDGQLAVLLRAYPMGNLLQNKYSSKTPAHTSNARQITNILPVKLPPGLRLIAIDENGNPIPGLAAVARSEPQDDYIALYFSAHIGDRFSVQIALENAIITEQFVV